MSFTLRNDPDYWYLNNVFVYAGGTEMLTNTGFETGSLSPWVRTAPNGYCGAFPAMISNSNCLSGSYCATDGSNGCADALSQQYTATAGQVYTVSFWLKSPITTGVITGTLSIS